MKEVTMRKSELAVIVSGNREEHRGKFEEALEGYRREAIRQLEEHIERIRDGEVKEVYVHLPAPQDHTGDYDRVLGMLSHEIAESVVLDSASYERYVMDRWSWTGAFEETYQTYSTVAE